MCGRFAQYHLSQELLRKIFRIDHVPDSQTRFNIAPTDDALTIGENPETGERSAQYLRWGLLPFWVDDPAEFDLDLINARIETAAEKNSFRRPFHNQRCIIPANGFYEWTRTESGKQPHWVHPKEDELFGFAGLWDCWKNEETGDRIQSFTILTMEANEKIAKLHNRMPVILERDHYGDWLDTNRSDPEELMEVLDEFPSDRIDFHPVSKAMNNPEYDREKCVEPVSMES